MTYIVSFDDVYSLAVWSNQCYFGRHGAKSSGFDSKDMLSLFWY